MVVEVEKLYGIIHNCPIKYLFYSGELYLKPSKGILEELSKLPSGTSVGIERLSPEEYKLLENLVIEKVKVGLDDGSGQFWSKIIHQCNQSKLNIFYLDNANLIKEYMIHDVLVYKLTKKASKSKIEEKRTELLRQRSAHYVESRYTQIFKREEQMLNKIKELSPKIVILGLGHTEYLWSNQNILKSEGIIFKSYACEELPNLKSIEDDINICMSEGIEDADFISRNLPPNLLINNPSFADEKLIQERNTVERKYNALKKGRITTKIPNFIGTWDLDFPINGFFEMFIEESDGERISGSIEDIFGKSVFAGTINEYEIRFAKTYEPSAIIAGGGNDEIYYIGEKEGNKFKGVYNCRDGGSDLFEMIPFNKDTITK